MTGKKVLVVCLVGARLLLQPEKNSSRKIIQFFGDIECIKFECNKFVLVFSNFMRLQNIYGRPLGGVWDSLTSVEFTLKFSIVLTQ